MPKGQVRGRYLIFMKISTIIHPIAVFAWMLFPIMFVGPGEEITLERYLFRSCMPFMMVVLFYLNYLWIVPRCIAGQFKLSVFHINVIMVITTCVLVALVRGYEFSVSPANFHIHDREPHPERQFSRLFFLFASIRDAINFIFVALAAYSLRMTSHAHRLEHERQETEMARRDAELKGLRSQISPHFLLNTLNNIYALTAISSDRAQQAIIQLSELLRHMLYDNQQDMVDFSSECKFINSYVDLMKLRMASNVKVNVEIVIPENDKSKVAPLLFISLVENAFKHGVSSIEPSTISIKLAATEAEIRCEIVNTNYPKTGNDRSGHGIGLQQVERRLNTVYPGRYSWTHGVSEVDGMYHSEIVLKK